MRPQRQEEPLAAYLEQQKNEALENCDRELCRLCNVMNVGQLEILLHKLSTHHLKKWRAGIRLRSKCIACSVSSSDIKAAETHVRGSGHEHRMIHGFKQRFFIGSLYNCPPCGIAFQCGIALELHLAMTHKVALSTENLPEVMNVIQLLSGSSTEASKANIDLKCYACQTNYEAMDDFVMHLFSNTHVQCLRASACVVCDKNFIHVSDREAHLSGPKHESRVQKSCLSNNLGKAMAIEQLERAGYLCMYCMVWCKSWPCFMLHLVDKYHRSYAGKQAQQHMNRMEHNVLKASKREAIEDIACPSISVRNWKKWLDQPVGLSAWCNVCEETFPSPEATEKHLEDHHDLQIIDARKRAHPPSFLTYAGQEYNCFECKDCCVVFKSPLALTVHEAFRQHHMQQHRTSGGGISFCRMQRRAAESEKTVMPNLQPAEGGDSQHNMANVGNQLAKVSKSETEKESSDENYNMDEFDRATENEHEFSDSINKEECVPFEAVEKGKMDSEILGAVCVNSCSGDRSLPVIERLEAEGKPPRDANPVTTEQQCHNKDGPDCHQLNDRSIPVGSKKMIPVVIAAALPPSESIQSSLQSTMKLVTESLFAALPKIRKPATEVCSGRKRPRCEMHDVPPNKNEDTNLGAILEASVFEGLQSWNSCSSSSEAPVAGGSAQDNPKRDQKPSSCMENSSALPSMSISIKNEQGISVVLAAAAIPQASGTEAPSPTCPRTGNRVPFSTDLHDNSREMAMGKTCDTGQNVDGTRRECVESDAVQEYDNANPVGNQSE